MQILLLNALLLANSTISFANEVNVRKYLVGCHDKTFTLLLEFQESRPDWERRDFTLKIVREGKHFATTSKIGYELITMEKSGQVRGREISFEGQSVGPKAVAFHGKLSILDNNDADYGGHGNDVQAVLALYTDEHENPVNPPDHRFGLSCSAVSNEF